MALKKNAEPSGPPSPSQKPLPRPATRRITSTLKLLNILGLTPEARKTTLTPFTLKPPPTSPKKQKTTQNALTRHPEKGTFIPCPFWRTASRPGQSCPRRPEAQGSGCGPSDFSEASRRKKQPVAQPFWRPHDDRKQLVVLLGAYKCLVIMCRAALPTILLKCTQYGSLLCVDGHPGPDFHFSKV